MTPTFLPPAGRNGPESREKTSVPNICRPLSPTSAHLPVPSEADPKGRCRGKLVDRPNRTSCEAARLGRLPRVAPTNTTPYLDSCDSLVREALNLARLD